MPSRVRSPVGAVRLTAAALVVAAPMSTAADGDFHQIEMARGEAEMGELGADTVVQAKQFSSANGVQPFTETGAHNGQTPVDRPSTSPLPTLARPVRRGRIHAGDVITVNRVGPIVGTGGKCVHVAGGATADSTKVQLLTCNSTAAQAWSRSGQTLRVLGHVPRCGGCGQDGRDQRAVVHLQRDWRLELGCRCQRIGGQPQLRQVSRRRRRQQRGRLTVGHLYLPRRRRPTLDRCTVGLHGKASAQRPKPRAWSRVPRGRAGRRSQPGALRSADPAAPLEFFGVFCGFV